MLLFELVQCITLPLPLQRLALAVSTIAGPLQVFTLASSQGLSSPGQQLTISCLFGGVRAYLSEGLPIFFPQAFMHLRPESSPVSCELELASRDAKFDNLESPQEP